MELNQKLKSIGSHFNSKYSLAERKLVIRLFKSMTAREVAKRVGLTHGQVIGILETSRRYGLIDGSFKDTRNRKPWTFKERLSLIKMAGLVNREEIGKRLNRNGQRNIKERIKKDFSSGTKFLHGLPITWARELIPMDLEDRKIETSAGPRGSTNGKIITCFRIIPWVDMEQVSYAIKLPKQLEISFRGLARFQRFIWQCDEDYKIRDYLKGVINGKRSFT